MKYIDTNVLVRVITGDDKALAEKAIAQIESGAQNEFSILDAVLVELCFVLEFHDYKMSRLDIATAIETLLAIPQIFVTDITLRALRLYKEHSKFDYTDCLLFVVGGKNGIVTFDDDLRKILM
ncbi:MAG TPA: PIN domain-containing protein [Candidatus Dormibacteraeota bacterium]|nr:PIN domain-containing protein [Candidatus Dormibacteraeota bacterium]